MAADTTTAEIHDHPHPNYMAVFYALFALTVIEVFTTTIGLAEWVMIIALLVMALVKAIMVALYFMHLKYDNIVLSIIAGVPLVLVCIAVAVLAYEYTHNLPPLPPVK